MIDLIASSGRASAAVARRTIRGIETEATTPLEAVIEAVTPLMLDLKRRGKLPREALESRFRDFVAQIGDMPAIVDLDTTQDRARHGRPPEARYARLVTTTATDEDQLCVVTMTVAVSRAHVAITMRKAGLTITRHALERFIQRERRAPKDFMAGITATLKANRLLLASAIREGCTNVGVPFASGLLLGEVGTARTETPLRWEYSQRGGSDIQVPAVAMPETWSPVARLKTFVDGDGLGPRKARLLEAVAAWQRRHAVTIHQGASLHLFDGPIDHGPTTPDEEERCRAAIAIARAELEALVREAFR